MLCWNTVSDYARCRAVFDSERERHTAAGLHLEWVRLDQQDPGRVFLMFAVEDLERAQAFIAGPVSSEAKAESGAIDGACWYIHDPA
ncbi:hypothetical protein DRQ53_10270 [bacterium]|nr:MAG: hypothetical protein DRQ32_02960 [bacterium]RKZ14947.1 MAG: hypothetical protein DRQ53_10270 [bacterium]